jgi:hypothetical protein
LKSNELVTTDMLSAKKRFQRQMKEARTPARNLFPDGGAASKEDEFVEVPELAAPSPFKPSLGTALTSGKSTENKRNFSCVLRCSETGLETTTDNLIQN